MESIKLYCIRKDRLGSHILQYLSIVIFAVYNNLYIIYEKDELNYTNSIFVKSILNFVDNHNERFDTAKINTDKYNNLHIQEYWLEFETNVLKHNYYYTSDLCIIGQQVIKSIEQDLISYFKKYMMTKMNKSIKEFLPSNYTVPFDPKNTILVHLRLDDVRDRSDYDGSYCSNYYRNRINNDNNMIQGIRDLGYANLQTPLAREKVNKAIEEAKQKYPSHEVIIVTAPGDYEIDYPYRTIRNDDESYDLYLLCNCDVLILSRSTFSLVATFFGSSKEVWSPLWGHFVCTGLYTKYDNSKFNYFF